MTNAVPVYYVQRYYMKALTLRYVLKAFSGHHRVHRMVGSTACLGERGRYVSNSYWKKSHNLFQWF